MVVWSRQGGLRSRNSVVASDVTFPKRYIPTALTPPPACLYMYATTERGNGTTELRGGSNSQGSPCREARGWGESTRDGSVWCQE